MRCENCCYFAETDAEEWNGKAHCCFREWGHMEDEIAPCDEPQYEEINYYNIEDYI